MKKLLPFLPAALGVVATVLIYLAYAKLKPASLNDVRATLSNSALLPGLALLFIGLKRWASTKGFVRHDPRFLKPRTLPKEDSVPGDKTPMPPEAPEEPLQKPKVLRFLLPGLLLFALAILLAFLPQ